YPVAEGIASNAAIGNAAFGVSTNGVLVYRSVAVHVQLLWLERSTGKTTPILEPGDYSNPALSPDGRKIAFARRESFQSANDIWLMDIESRNTTKFAFESENEAWPLWTQDGSAIVFSRGPRLYRKSVTGARSEEFLVETKGTWALPYSWSPDGNLLFYNERSPGEGLNVLMLTMGLERKRILLFGSAFDEAHGSLSPDGRWLAYTSSENTKNFFEIYLSDFPPSGAKQLVTTTGGTRPRWSRDGKVLFYSKPLSPELLSVDVITEPTLEIGPPKTIYRGPMNWGPFQGFDVTPDERRFLIDPVVQDTGSGAITVVLNWTAALSK
ncbi:MAG: PD40 domain-containing protein, partial [Acidobacteria bacterium]|nr:PD40 domain-containing protein [Acidobacteriota bacterium]